MAIYTDLTLSKTKVTEITDEASINNSLKNLFATPLGSVAGKPKFGTRIHSVLFSLITFSTEGTLREIIKEEIAKFEPRIELLEIGIQNVPEYNLINLVITYQFPIFGMNKVASTKISFSN
jgi:uncharacterized protein